jgi:hypothetical protein
MKILTIYDGTIQARTALQYGLRKAGEKKAELIVLQVFQSSLFVDYDAGPRAEEIARAEAARHRREAEAIISAARSVLVRFVSEDGETVDTAARIAANEQVDLILCSPRYKSLAKRTDRPVYIIPGTILVPVDGANAVSGDREAIIAEARLTGSRVLLLGVVPVHLYTPAEQEELEQVRKRTAAAVKKERKMLEEQSIEAADAVRSGYPDEEILKAAEEFAVSLIMLPMGGKTPSEVTKAAAILLEEPERIKRPVTLIVPGV